MWRHNYVIGRNEYLISTWSESIVPWVYSLQFLFKSTHHSWRYERKCEWVFFFWTQCSGILRSWTERVGCLMRVYVLNCGTLLFRVSYSVYSPAQCDMKPERVTIQRSATSTKQVLLDWCKRRVSGYKVSRSTLYYYRLLLLLLQAPLGVRSAKHRHQSPLSGVDDSEPSSIASFIQGEVAGFQVLLDGLHPRTVVL